METTAGSANFIPEVEIERMACRCHHANVFKLVQQAKLNFGEKAKKVKPTMYVIPVGRIPRLRSTQFDSEMVENDLEHAILYENLVEFVDKRQEFAVIEDNFGPTLEQMMKASKTPSYVTLIETCKAYCGPDEAKIHTDKSAKTFRVFTNKGIPEDDAKAYAFAIAFYTGAYSAKLSMEANILGRGLVGMEGVYPNESTVATHPAIIMYYLVRALAHLDFYWGVVVRYMNLDDRDLMDYTPGQIVTWLQFSSSDKGGKDMSHFEGRNTKFTIYSLTARSIQYFSNCSSQEDEVLFLPHSTFIVCETKYDKISKKNIIFLRQVELGLCKNVVLWVDDNIFDTQWENKRHMEKASTLGTHVNVHFVPKSNTESALAFLRSEFGQRIKCSQTFRIVTDMKRTNESSPNTAGARFIYEVRKLGFKQSCLIFTGHEEKAKEKLKSVFGSKHVDRVKITSDPDVIEKFVIFKDYE